MAEKGFISKVVDSITGRKKPTDEEIKKNPVNVAAAGATISNRKKKMEEQMDMMFPKQKK